MPTLSSTLAYVELWQFAQYSMLLAFGAIVLCALRPVRRAFAAARRCFTRLDRRPVRTALALAFLAVLLTAALAPFRGIPIPFVHDEFGYLLTADTFANGRLTNPTHPFWQHFESMQIFHRPTYQGKYPAGQGAILAVGQVVFGHPIAGVWLAQALAAAAFYWALRAWLKPAWAVAGGLALAVHPILLVWGQRYWGGSLAIVGAALFTGGLGRLLPAFLRPRQRGQTPSPTDPPPLIIPALAMAAGAAILANTRPFEGFILVALVALTLAILWLVNRRLSLSAILTRILVPMAAILVPVAAAMMCYNARVTGSPLRLPYQVHHAAYDVCPLFIFQKPAPAPSYNHVELYKFHVIREMHWYHLRDTFGGALREAAANLFDRLYNGAFGNIGEIPNPLYTGFPGAPDSGWQAIEGKQRKRIKRLEAEAARGSLSPRDEKALLDLRRQDAMRALVPRRIPVLGPLVLLAIPFALRRDARMRLAILLIALFAAALMTETYMLAHYAAPVAVLVAFVILQSLRRLRTWRPRGRPVGRFLVHAAFAVAIVGAAHWWIAFAAEPQDAFARRRRAVEQSLLARPGNHLVIVRYAPNHPDLDEWVFNSADIDGSRIVWARDMGPEKNAKLIDYFKARNAWLLESDVPSAVPVPWPAPATRPAPPSVIGSLAMPRAL